MSRAWYDRAVAAVAGFTSTRSKTPDAMFGGPGGPTHMVKAQGARVWTADGRELLDWTMALGSVSLGYAYPSVVAAMERAVADSVIGPLPSVLEVEAAERLCRAYPGAEQARFFKTGAEAVQAAVRIARVATSRTRVVYCGYHGWLDGPTTGAGVPAGTSGLWEPIPFGDVKALEAALVRPAAAVVLEPVIEAEPPREWLVTARALCAEQGVALIYDEVKTAFRIARGGAAQRWGVIPDLAVLGKAMANGAPLAAVVGKRQIMARARETWISSTLAAESAALAAAIAVMDEWEKHDVAAHITRTGTELLRRLPAGPWTVVGLPEMWLLRFSDAQAEHLFALAGVEQGVLLKRGAYNFPSFAHGEPEIARTVAAVQAALERL